MSLGHLCSGQAFLVGIWGSKIINFQQRSTNSMSVAHPLKEGQVNLHFKEWDWYNFADNLLIKKNKKTIVLRDRLATLSRRGLEPRWLQSDDILYLFSYLQYMSTPALTYSLLNTNCYADPTIYIRFSYLPFPPLVTWCLARKATKCA